jgi:hypothetical protein
MLRISIAVALLVVPLPSPVSELEADPFDDLFHVPLEYIIDIHLQDSAHCLPSSEQQNQSLFRTLLHMFRPMFCDEQGTEGIRE